MVRLMTDVPFASERGAVFIDEEDQDSVYLFDQVSMGFHETNMHMLFKLISHCLGMSTRPKK